MTELDRRYLAARLVLRLRQAGVMDQRVTQALEMTPREIYTPLPFEDVAWNNAELPIDCGQSMTPPVTVGVMLEALGASEKHLVLEVGTGTGYIAGVLSRLARRVYSIDRYRTLVDKARNALRIDEARNVEVRHADGLLGWPEAAPFDRILLMGAVERLPEALAGQVATGGVVVMPVERAGKGLIVRLEREADGSFRETVVAPAGFAPLQPGIAREL